jgi:hypothetical protein
LTSTKTMPVSPRPDTGDVCLRDAGGRLLRMLNADEAQAMLVDGRTVWYGAGRRRHLRVSVTLSARPGNRDDAFKQRLEFGRPWALSGVRGS